MVRGVRFQVVAREPVRETVEAVGTVRSKTQTLIASKVLGYVREVRFREGDRVEAGQLLVAVEEREFVARVDLARAALDEASMALEEAKRTLEEAEAGLRSAEADHAYAAATAARSRRLLDQELISPQDYEGAEAKRKSTEAAMEQARARILAVKARQEQARQRIAQAQAELQTAQLTLADTRIAAPSTGVVVERHVEPGDLALPGQRLLALDDPRHYRLEAVVGESAMGHVRLGQTVPVAVDALSRILDGRVVEVVPAADPQSRSVTVKLDLPPDPALRSGAFGRARFPAGQRPVLLVPAGALVERGQLTGVYVVDGESVARLRLITVGQRHGDRVEVLSGLAPGERIVVEGVERLADGRRVEALP